MSANENACDIRAEEAAPNEVQDVQTINNEPAASVVEETKPSVSDQKNPDHPNAQPTAQPTRNANRHMSDLMKASDLHCPFVWRKDLDASSYLDHEIDLMSSAEEMFDNLGFQFRRYVIHLVLCYHNFYKRNIKECMEHIDELDRMMKHSSRKDNSDYLFNVINDALYHVIHSCRIYIYDTTEQKDRTQQILNKIKSYDSMDDANKAGLWAIRANVYVEYGYEGVKNAISYMRKATKLDPENAFWHFMLGMYLGRQRRIEGGHIMPENEEFQSLRMAIELREDPAFIAFAGEAYSETAKTAKHLNALKKSDKESEKQVALILQGLNEVAAKYFKTSIELKPNSSHLLFRCGKGLINLPPPHQDIKLGLSFVRKGLEISPDSGYGNHVMAMFLEKIEKKPSLAKEFLDISIKKNNFPAHMDMIRIDFQESKNAQKLWESLKQTLELYIETPRRRRILGEMVCYHLFVDYDLVEACFDMRKLIRMNSTSVDIINNHRTMILPLVTPIPLSDLIFNRIKASLKDRKLPDLCREVFAKYIQFLIDENVEPKEVKDEVFGKIKHQIELGLKNKMQPVDEDVRDAQKRVRGAHEFEADPCADEELQYLDFYKNDLKDTNVGKTRGVGDNMVDILHQMGQNPLPKRRYDEDMSDGDHRRSENGHSSRHRDQEKERSRRHSNESSRSSRKHHRRRSYSSSSTSRSSYSSSSSSDRRSSKKHHRGSRNRRRSPSSRSSYSSSSSSSSDRYSKSSRRRKEHRRRSSSYDSKRSRSKHRRRDATPDKYHKKSKHRRSPSTSTSSGSETSISSRSGSTLRRRSKEKETDSEKLVTVPKGTEAATQASQPSKQLPETDAETTVDHVQAIMDNLSISSRKSSRRSSPQPVAAGTSDMPDAGPTKNSGQSGENQNLDKAEGSEVSQKSSKRRENREDSDGSVKTTTSRTSGASKRSSKCRSRDRSVDSARTNSSRLSEKKDKSSRRRRSSRSSSRSSSGDRSSQRSSGRSKRSERRQTPSPPDLIGSSTPSRSERRSKDDGKKDSTKHGQADRRSLPKESKESKYSEDEKRHRQKEDRDRRKTVSSQSSD